MIETYGPAFFLSPHNIYQRIITFQVVLLNCLTSEFIVLAKALEENENVVGIFLLNALLFIYGDQSWCSYDFRGNLQNKLVFSIFCSNTSNCIFKKVPTVKILKELKILQNYNDFRYVSNEESDWKILDMYFNSPDDYRVVYWSGNLDDGRLKLQSVLEGEGCEPISFFK